MFRPENTTQTTESAPEQKKAASEVPGIKSEAALLALKTELQQRVATAASNEIESGSQAVERGIRAIDGGPEDIQATKAGLAGVQQEIIALETATLEALAATGAEIEVAPESELLPEAEARKKWGEFSLDQKLAYCNPEVVKQEMNASLTLEHPPQTEAFDEQAGFQENLEKINSNVDTLLAAFVQEQHISLEYAQIVGKSVKEYVGLMRQAQEHGQLDAGLKAGAVNKVAEDLARKMVYQNKESLKRALGDHGVRHIINGNIAEAQKLVDEYNRANPGKPLSAMDRLKIMTIHFNHDMGYTVGINRTGFESASDHKYFSQKLFDSDQAVYGQVFSENDLRQVSDAIRTHDEAETDFANRPVESIVRLSDNLGLFHDSKLPEILYRNPGNLAILQKIYIARESGQDIGGLQEQLKLQISGRADLDENTRGALLNAAGEIFKGSPEFTLGMFAGKLEGYRMNENQMVVQLRASDMHKQIQDLFQLGQQQFVKLLGIYGIKLKKLGKSFDEYVKVDESGVKYVELPPDSEGVRPLRFEFLPEEVGVVDQDNEAMKQKFAETQSEWSEINIREEIKSIASVLEQPENRTPENLAQLTSELNYSVSTRMEPEDMEALSALSERLKENLGDEIGFAAELANLKKFMTQKEKIFLAIKQ